MKIDIKENEGYLVMEDLPDNCIFNKARTGCGATTIAINNSRNYVIAVPTNEIITNKCYPIDKSGQWQAKGIKPGLSPVKNLFGLYGEFTDSLKSKLKDYLKQEGTKKIICSYDKIPMLIKLINPKEFKLLVDEYHHFLRSYMFRDKAINGVLENFNDFDSFCFMSATPIPNGYHPDELKGVVYYEADWKEIETIRVLPYQTDKPYMIAAKIIKAYKEDGYIMIDGQKSEEAYFFVNSVTEIEKILTQAKLEDDDCRIICADNDRNLKKLKGYHISSSTEQPKKFNFITSKSFEGVDYFSETGICFVVSNSFNTHTLLSIEMDIPQIVGRIRTKSNPFRNKLVHIFNKRAIDAYDSYHKLEQELNNQLKYARERVLAYAGLSKGAKEQQRKEIEKATSFLKYNKKTDSFAVNDMLIKALLYNYKIMNVVYQSGSSLRKEYMRTGIKAQSTKWETAPDDFVKKCISRPLFRECKNRYIKLKEEGVPSEEIDIIEGRYPFLMDAYEKLGAKELKRQKSIKGIIEILNNN